MLRTLLTSASLGLLVVLAACKGDDSSGDCTSTAGSGGNGGSCAGGPTTGSGAHDTGTGTGTGKAPTGNAACVMAAGATVLFCQQYVASPTGGGVEEVHKQGCLNAHQTLAEECPAGYFGCCVEKDSASGHFKSCFYAAAGDDPAAKKKSCEDDGDTWE